MKQLKTINQFGTASYLPYSERNIETIQSTNRNGKPAQQMTLQIVDVVMGRDEQGQQVITSESVTETIFQPSGSRSNPATIDKEIQLSEKELELQIKEERLRKLEAEINKRQKVNA